jgi:hypothetical protein
LNRIKRCEADTACNAKVTFDGGGEGVPDAVAVGYSVGMAEQVTRR